MLALYAFILYICSFEVCLPSRKLRACNKSGKTKTNSAVKTTLVFNTMCFIFAGFVQKFTTKMR